MEHIVTFPHLNIEMTVKETAFTVGGFSVQWYGLLIGLGFLIAILYAFSSVKKLNIDEDKLIDAVMGGIVGGIIGARAYYIIFFPGDFFTGDTLSENIYQAINIHSGGLGFYGGFIGALLCGGIVAKIRKMNIPALFDVVGQGFLMGLTVGRWGNFVNQEAFGEATNLPWGMASDNTGGLTVHPCFLYESLACLLGFLLIHVFCRKFRRYDGQVFLLCIIWYGLLRFFVEQLRTDSLMIGNIRVSVLVAALFVVLGSLILMIFRKRTALTGCGNAAIMKQNGVEFGSLQREREAQRAEEEAAAQEKNTILGDDTGRDNPSEATDQEGASQQGEPENAEKDSKETE